MKRKSLLLLWLLAIILAPRWGFAQDITLNSSQTIALTPGTTRNFYDSGGSGSNYGNSESYTLTLTSGGDITVNFSSFATESSSGCYDWDHMTIYDGSTSGTQLAYGQTGCSSSTLTTGTNYTATSGTMTIVWKSDGSTNAAGWVATITAASVPGLVPFVDGLETSTWYLVNGSCTNKWYLGSPGARYGTAGLYISNDSGTTNAYSTGSTSVVYAYKEVTFPSAGKYNLSFDIKQYGESTWDCVGAMLYDNNTSPSASTTSAGSGLTSFPSGYTTMITGVGYSFSSGAWKTSSTDFTVAAAGQYKLTFCWKNDSSGGTQPPAAIDNVIVTKVNDVTAVTSPDGTGSMTASLTWGFDDGTYQGWSVINNDSDVYPWMTLGTLTDYTNYYSNPTSWAHNGNGAVVSGSFINNIGALTNIDNYLVSPRLILGGSISFYAKSLDADYPEQFGVAVCTSDNPTASNFTTIQTWTGASDTDWHLYTVDLSAYTDYGYVAIRNYGTTDQYMVIVDDITITSRSVSNFNRPLASGVSATFNVTPNSGVSFTQWTNNGATVSTSNSYTFTVQEPSALVAVMDVPATVPYTQDFESADHGWAMINGSCANKWYCGAPGGKNGGNGLYISSDNGTNNTYNNSSSTYAYTYKSLTFSEAGDYILLFDLRQQGEGTWDCVGAMLYSSSTTPSPSTSYGSSGLNSWPSGYSQFIVGAGYDASGGNWAKISQTFTLSTAGTYKLVFGWKNDSGGGTNPPASIDNVIVKKIPTYYNVDASANPSSAGNVKFLVGDNGTTTNSYLPCYTLYNYNLTQQIYTPEEIGNVGTINSIAFYNGGDTKTLSDLEFYMVHTGKDQFGSNTDWISVTANDLVYSGTDVEMTAGQWTIINLTTPFVYDGLSNLAIVTREHMQWSSGLGCRVFTPASGGYCSIYAYNDNNAYDVTNPSQYSGTRLTVKNQILVNPGGSLTRQFPQGATVTLVEELTNSDYHFENWTDNSSNAGNNEIYTISNLAGAHTVVANYAPNTHTLTASVNPANSGTISANGTTISGATTYNHGTSVTLTPTPATGYDFVNWTVDGTTQTGSTYTVTMDQDHTVVANFELNTYTVSVSANPNEGGTVTGSGTYNHGASATVTATPATGYAFDNWTENGTVVSTSASYNFTVEGARNLVANFHLNQVAISVSANPSDGGTVEGGGDYTIGTQCTVSATAAEGHTFTNWTENGTEVSTSANYQFTVSTARTLVANFSLNNYTITVNSNWPQGGSADGSGEYAYGTVITISATANTGYSFSRWSDGNTDNPRTVTVTEDHTYVAEFTRNQYAITVVPHEGGSATAGATYDHGETCTVTAYPDEGHSVDGWYENGTRLTTDASYSFTVTGPRTLDAYFTVNQYAVTVTADPEEGGTVTGGGTFNYGASCTVTTTVNPGYSFSGWIKNGTHVSDNTSYTFTVEEATTMVANFQPDQTLTTYVNPMEGGYVTMDNVSTIGAVEVGNVSSTKQNNCSPYMTGADYSFQECLYPASEIGLANGGYITTISYYVQNVSGASAQTDDRIEIYMKNTTRTSFSSTSSDIERVTADDKVFEGSWHLTNTTGWVTIVLDEPFHYTGATLMIAFNELTPGRSEMNFKMTNFQSSGVYMNRYKYSTSPLDATSLTSLMSKDFDRANVRLGFGTYHHGTNVTLTANANTDFMFNGWTVDGNPVEGNNPTYTVAMDDDHTVIANFISTVFTKDITGHKGGNGNWYLISSPLAASVSPGNVENMVATSEEHYDLFYFEQAPEDGLEWVNYKALSDGFSLVNGKGYLYANYSDVTLAFRGAPYQGTGEVALTNIVDYNWTGWNLIGNPFYYDAYIGTTPYYRMNAGGTEIVAATAGTAIEPMEGIFVQYAAPGTVTFSATAPSKGANLALNITKDRGLIDRAIVNFGNSGTLAKFQLNADHTKVYIPQDGTDYAVVAAESSVGEIPVSFKAERNGTYTFSVNAEDVTFGYLHLIDNLTGADVDLLANPSYTFNAATTDYASRFRLVFVTGNSNDDNFGFYNGSEWVINNDGEATLQVIDVLGRILKSESIDGCARVNFQAAPGVYMLRLINGDNERTQKVIVR